MPAIAATNVGGSGARVAAATTLDGTDSFVYSAGAILILRNPTAGSLSPVIDGDGASTVPVRGVGNVNIASGYAVGSIGVGAQVAIPLDSIRAYLSGTIAVTGGTGLVATMLVP